MCTIKDRLCTCKSWAKNLRVNYPSSKTIEGCLHRNGLTCKNGKALGSFVLETFSKDTAKQERTFQVPKAETKMVTYAIESWFCDPAKVNIDFSLAPILSYSAQVAFEASSKVGRTPCCSPLKLSTPAQKMRVYERPKTLWLMPDLREVGGCSFHRIRSCAQKRCLLLDDGNRRIRGTPARAKSLNTGLQKPKERVRGITRAGGLTQSRSWLLSTEI